MAIFNFHDPTKQIFWGNLLLIVCCAFYLSWWLLAFKPVGAIKGMKTGWLLLPAFLAGVAAVALTLRGLNAIVTHRALFPRSVILWGGIAAYLLLLVITMWLFHRPVTTELILIVAWTMLALSEVNALYGAGVFSLPTSIACSIVIPVVTLICLVCYVLYYHLGPRAGYIAGMAPLLLAALTIAGISIGMTASA